MPTVRMLPADVRVEVPRGTRLTDAIRSGGQPIAAPCGDDLICGRCAVRILAGHVTRAAAVEREVMRQNRVPAERRLACAIRVHEDLVVTTDYWGPLQTNRALVLLDHGSRHAEAHAHLEALAEQLRRSRPELRLYVAHMELAEPSLAAAVARCAHDGMQKVDVLPLFLAPGRHLTRDLPEQIAAAKAEHPTLEITLLDAIGARPELADWILTLLAPRT